MDSQKAILEGLNHQRMMRVYESGDIIPADIPSSEWNSMSWKDRCKIYYDFVQNNKGQTLKLSRNQKTDNYRRVSRLGLGVPDPKGAEMVNAIINLGADEGLFLKGDIDKIVKDFSTGKKFSMKKD